MHLVARLLHTAEAAELLREAGCELRLIQHNTMMVVRLPGLNQQYSVPALLAGKPLQIDITEKGGLSADLVRVVCAEGGVPLHPYCTLQKPLVVWRPNVWQARFQSAGPLVRVTLTPKQDPLLTLDRLQIVRNGDTAVIQETPLFTGSLQDPLPGWINRYEPAIRAVFAKATCEECQCAHYTATK